MTNARVTRSTTFSIGEAATARTTREALIIVGEAATARATRETLFIVGEAATARATRAALFIIADAVPGGVFDILIQETPPTVSEALLVEGLGVIDILISDIAFAQDLLAQAAIISPVLTAGIIPSGAVYLDLVTSDNDASTPALMNTFPADGQDDIPATDRGGSHPFAVTVVDPGGTGFVSGATIIDLSVNRLDAVTENPPASQSSVVLTGRRIDVRISDVAQLEETLSVVGTDIIDIVVADRATINERMVSGLDEQVYDGTSFTVPWAAYSELDEVASDGGVIADEQRFLLIRDRAFRSLEVVTIDVQAEVL